jgi:hypothetical protein
LWQIPIEGQIVMRKLHTGFIFLMLVMEAGAPLPISGQTLGALRNPAVIQEAGHVTIPPLKLGAAPAALTSKGSPEVLRGSPSAGAEASTGTGQPDVYVQNFTGVRLPASMVLNFEGIDAPSNDPFPAPDPNGAVGATQYVEWVNSRFAVYNKQTGGLVYGPVPAVSLFQSLSGPCGTQNAGDGVVEYDKAAGVWVITHRVGATSLGPYYQCIAVSKTSDATQGWNLYSFEISSNLFPDYPKLSVWADAYYETANLFSPSNWSAPVGSLVCAFNRTAMLAGQAATVQCFQTPAQYQTLLPADIDGNAAPPSGSPNYLLNLDVNSLDLWEFHVDFTNPSNSTLTGPANIPVAAFTDACSYSGYVCIPQGGSPQVLDSLGDRLMYRLAYRNFGSYESLVVNHSVNPPTQAYAGIRWYEIRSPGSNPYVYQQGTFSPDANSRWLASAAMDQEGDIAIGYSVSSAYFAPGIRITGRLATDPLGTLEAEERVAAGSGAELSPDYRWGDYSSMAVDPSDDCTFWYTGEYLNSTGTNNWSTRVMAFKFNACP